jgi:hypothetical protein
MRRLQMPTEMWIAVATGNNLAASREEFRYEPALTQRVRGSMRRLPKYGFKWSGQTTGRLRLLGVRG